MADPSPHNAIWQVLDRVRANSPLTNSEFSTGLAALIFLRWADFVEAEREAVSAFDDANHKLKMPVSLQWRSWCDVRDPRELERIFHKLPKALDSFPSSGHDGIAAQLHHIAPAVETLSRFPADSVAHLIEWLGLQPFETPSDRRALRNVLDTVLLKTVDKFTGQFFTPAQIAAFMVEMAQPKYGESIFDPCFGSAGLLTAALEFVEVRDVTSGKSECATGNPPLHLAGVEINQGAYIIGLTRLVLSGISNPQIELGNSLERAPAKNPSSEGFDLVLANPPWGIKVRVDRMGDYPIPTRESSSLFLQHAISQLRPGGRAVLVVPPGLLFRSGRERELRRWLVEEHTVETIVSIPRGAFSPHTSIETCVLMVRRNGKTRSVRMVNANTLPRRLGVWNRDEVIRAVRSIEASASAWDVDVKDLAEVDFDLTAKRRDRSGIEKILKSLPKELEVKLLRECCHVMSGRNVRSDMLQDNRPQENEDSLEIESPDDRQPLSELDKEIGKLQWELELDAEDRFYGREPGDSESPWDDSRLQLLERLRALEQERVRRTANDHVAIPYVRIRDVYKDQAAHGSSWLTKDAATSIDPDWKLRAGDIVLSKSGTIGKVGIVRGGAVGAIAASGFFVLRANGGIDPHYLLAYLKSSEVSAWLDDHARGSFVKRLSLSAIKQLPLVVPTLQLQQRTAEQHRKFDVDALTYLVETLSDDSFDSLASDVNNWVSSHLRNLEKFEGDTGGFSVLELLEEIGGSASPIAICKYCKHPYHVDYNTSYLDPPHNYAKGISTSCLACWLDVGPGSDTIESLSKDSSLVPWLLAFTAATQMLSSVSRIPDPVGILNVLQTGKANLDESAERIQGHLPNEQKARELTERLIALIDAFLAHLVSDNAIVVNVIDAVEDDDGNMLLRVNVENRGKLPIYDVKFELTPPLKPIGDNGLPYLVPMTPVELVFRGTNQRYSDDQLVALQWSAPDFSLSWTARTLIGGNLADKRDLVIRFRRKGSELESQSDRATESLGGSPYITGDPLKPEDDEVFVGREELLDQIRRQVTQSGNVVLLEGNRRAGKSSVLWHLEGATAIPGWLGVYCSLQGMEGDNEGGIRTAEVFRGIAYEVVQSVRKLNGSAVLPDGSILDGERGLGIVRSVRQGISKESPFQDFREYIELIMKTLTDQGLGLLLMFDEFDKLQEGIDKGITSPQVPENIRFLVQSFPKFSAILTGSLKRMREEYWSVLFGLGTPLRVSVLSSEAAARLITEPVNGRLSYAKSAVERAYSLTAGHPFLLQCLCSRVFDIAARCGVRSITIDHVNDAAAVLVEDNEHFAFLWDYIEFDRRRFLLFLLHRGEDGPDPMRLGVIEAKLEEEGVELREEIVIADLEKLRELELVKMHGESTGAYYTLTIPMMGQWLDEQKDYEVLRRRARAEAEDLSGKIRELRRLHSEMKELEDNLEDDDD